MNLPLFAEAALLALAGFAVGLFLAYLRRAAPETRDEIAMVEVYNAYWPIILVALAIGLITGYLLLRPRQRVNLTDSAPIRPHMPPRRSGEGKGLSDEIAAATSDVAGQMLGSHVHRHLPGASGPPDNLERLKGVGPKLATMLNAMGSFVSSNWRASPKPRSSGSTRLWARSAGD